jgi:methylmalonyl-CoA/ethylmalonyl-CoA epimerase
MGLNKIEHLGIAVKDLDAAEKVYEALLGRSPYKREKVESEGVATSFFMTGENKIELLAALNEDSPIAKFIAKKGEGIHHVAFDVENIEEEIKRLEENGFELISKEPKKGADNKIIAFLHPKSTGGVLVELCQEIK